MDFFSIVSTLFPLFALLGIGALLRHKHWMSESTDHQLVRLCMNLLYPCLVFHAILGIELLKSGQLLLLAFATGWGTMIIGYALGYVVSLGLGYEEAFQRRTFAYSVAVCNFAYIGIPIAQKFYEAEVLAVLLAVNVSVELALWMIAGVLRKTPRFEFQWKKTLNPPLLAIVACLILNALGAKAWMPSFVLQTASMLGQSFIPMVFLVFGATCYTLILEHRKTLRKRIALSGCLLRLGVIPAILLLGAVVLPLPWELKACLAIHAAVPAALIPIVIARHYHGDVATATTVSLSTIVVSLLTMPLWVQLGLSLIGMKA